MFQETQQKQEQWEQDAKQMLQMKEQELNNLGCRRTLNLDRLAETRKKVNGAPCAVNCLSEHPLVTVWLVYF